MAAPTLVAVGDEAQVQTGNGVDFVTMTGAGLPALVVDVPAGAQVGDVLVLVLSVFRSFTGSAPFWIPLAVFNSSDAVFDNADAGVSDDNHLDYETMVWDGAASSYTCGTSVGTGGIAFAAASARIIAYRSASNRKFVDEDPLGAMPTKLPLVGGGPGGSIYWTEPPTPVGQFGFTAQTVGPQGVVFSVTAARHGAALSMATTESYVEVAAGGDVSMAPTADGNLPSGTVVSTRWAMAHRFLDAESLDQTPTWTSSDAELLTAIGAWMPYVPPRSVNPGWVQGTAMGRTARRGWQ
jgi:hypothetical protein